MSALLEVKDLSKSFGATKALQNIQFRLNLGEVHALMGENGAGKSTFMKILAGLEKPDSGQIYFKGERFTPKNVQEVLHLGIAMIHQELLMVPELSIAENLFLGREKTKRFSFWVNSKEQNQEAETLLQQIGITLPPTTPMKNLSVAEMQMVEIAKAISNNAQVIIMDEPTSAISDKEVATLFKIIAQLKAQGVGIIYISHKMDEIYQIADQITILRDGTYISTHPASEITPAEMIKQMVGRELTQLFPPSETTIGTPLLEVKNYSRGKAFQNINFKVHKGEVLGLAGLMGAGRTEVARVIYGLDQPDTGELLLEGTVYKHKSPKDAITNGIGYVSEDRKIVGLVIKLSVADNLTLANLPQYTKYGFLTGNSGKADIDRMIQTLRIKVASPNQKVNELSGGNQQKIAIAKTLLTQPKVIILDEPTRGIDIGAKAEIYKLIRNLTAEGIGIILISSELPEIIGLCDRVAVMAQGELITTLLKEEISQENIMASAVPK